MQHSPDLLVAQGSVRQKAQGVFDVGMGGHFEPANLQFYLPFAVKHGLPAGAVVSTIQRSRPTHPLNEGGDPLSSHLSQRDLAWASDRLIGS